MKTTFTEKFLREAFNRVSWSMNGPVGTGSVKPKRRSFLAELPRRIASKLGFTRPNWLLKPSDAFSIWCKLLPRLNLVDELLVDEESKRTLLEVIIYRCFGSRAATLPLDSEEFMHHREKAIKLCSPDRERIQISFQNWTLEHYDLSSSGWPIRLYSSLGGPLITFIREHYAYRDANIAVKEGDIVIDGGGCWGDTALYFAHLAGENGRIHVFEFDDENLKVLNKNLEENQGIAPRITIAKEALWDTSYETISINSNGPASRLNDEVDADSPNSKNVSTITIDDYVKRESLPKVDFIKMDIEGAEPNALRGAVETIKQFRPTLALSVYHDPEHFASLMEIVNELDLEYEFYMRHLIPCEWETVLYAKPISKL